MKKRVLLQTAVLLAATLNLSEVIASCFPPAKGQTPLEVLECLQSELDNQQKRIAELEKENERLRHAISVSSNGNVGIGTTSPGEKLQVSGNIFLPAGNVIGVGENGLAPDDIYHLYMGWNSSVHYGFIGTWDNSPAFRELRIEATPILLTDNGATRMIITGGNVGIGTTSPHYKLDVNGTIRGHNVSPSDQRYKQNIQTLENALTKLQELRGVSFEWKAQDAENQIGLIAQEVERVFPELVSTDSEGYKSIAYGQLAAVLIEAVKEQQQIIDQKSATIAELQLNWQEQQKENAAQQERIALLEAMMQEIAAVALSRDQDGDAISHNAN